MIGNSILRRVDSPKDLRSLGESELAKLAMEIRELIIDTTSRTGGHLGASLGVVELTIALLRTMEPPADTIIWDVGHQCYAYKILTGRRDRFMTLRRYGGISGFPRREESEYDAVNSGHAGSSISYGLGMSLARDLKGEEHTVAVVIGDGAMTSGVAYEAMNQVGHHLKSNLIIILNDNEMSISKNVGGISSHLSRLRIKPGYTRLKMAIEEILGTLPTVGEGILRTAAYIKDVVSHSLVPGILFEALGLKYVGPIDGHDISLMEKTLLEAKAIDGPVLIHVLTTKGKGFRNAEDRPDEFHGVSSFDRATGALKPSSEKSYTEIFAEEAVELAREDPRVVAITAAMKLGTGLEPFSRIFPGRFIDVGIAEQLGVNVAAGLALGGLRPIVAIYSTFLQRAFDQLSQELCIHNLPVLLIVDRAGLVGEDGATHHGYFDLSFLRILPNMTVMAPGSGRELAMMMRFGIDLQSPVALRFPRGKAVFDERVGREPLVPGRGETVKDGKDVIILAIGDMVSRAVEASGILGDRGISAGVVNARFAKPIDGDFLAESIEGRSLLVTLENNVLSGGFGSGVNENLLRRRVEIPTLNLGLPDSYVEHGTIDELLIEVGISPAGVADEISESLRKA